MISDNRGNFVLAAKTMKEGWKKALKERSLKLAYQEVN